MSLQHFQELEEYHLCQMKDFVDTYAKAWEHHHVLLGQVIYFMSGPSNLHYDALWRILGLVNRHAGQYSA